MRIFYVAYATKLKQKEKYVSLQTVNRMQINRKQYRMYKYTKIDTYI